MKPSERIKEIITQEELEHPAQFSAQSPELTFQLALLQYLDEQAEQKIEPIKGRPRNFKGFEARELTGVESKINEIIDRLN